jgi:N-hydroxyarylamine O-acetyltransferase
MDVRDISLEAYLDRVGLSIDGSYGPNIETLKILQLAHMQNIPFENLDVAHGHAISMSVDDVFNKLVHQKRGGYCFEHNTLFGAMLSTLGFSVTDQLARVLWNKPPCLQPFSHIVLQVETAVDGIKYLVDVGFGGMGSSAPLFYDSQVAQETADGRYLICHNGESEGMTGDNRVIKVDVDGTWVDMMCVRMASTPTVDLEQVNWFSCTHPTAMWKSCLFAARMIGTERHHVMNNTYCVRKPSGERIFTRVESVNALLDLLNSVFGLTCSELLGTVAADGSGRSFRDTCLKFVNPTPSEA